MEVSPAGELLLETWFEAPYYCMMHDFGVTRDYAVFHVVPIVSSWERLEAGLPHFGFDTSLPVYLGVLPRRDDARAMRWFKSPTLFASHVMNAFNDGTRVYFDTPVAKNNMFPFFPDVRGAPFNPMEAMSFLTRWTVDMASPAIRSRSPSASRICSANSRASTIATPPKRSATAGCSSPISRSRSRVPAAAPPDSS